MKDTIMTIKIKINAMREGSNNNSEAGLNIEF